LLTLIDFTETHRPSSLLVTSRFANFADRHTPRFLCFPRKSRRQRPL